MPRKTPSEADASGLYNADRCRATRRLRTRLGRLVARIDALEGELRDERAQIAAERAALSAYLDGPEGVLDGLHLAQRLLQEAVAGAVMMQAQCSECGGLGQGMTQNLLKDRIAAHCRDHGLSHEPPKDVPWPHVGAGQSRDQSWLRKKIRKRAAIW